MKIDRTVARHRERRHRERPALPTIGQQPAGREDRQDRSRRQQVREGAVVDRDLRPDRRRSARRSPSRASGSGRCRWARSRRSPVVFSDRNVAPCSRHSDTNVSPAKIAYGRQQVPERPGVLLVRVDRKAVEQVGQRDTDQERRQPGCRASARGPTRCATVGSPACPRNSNETPRTISATSSSSIARYRPENIVAYHGGNAAKMPGARRRSATPRCRPTTARSC